MFDEGSKLFNDHSSQPKYMFDKHVPVSRQAIISKLSLQTCLKALSDPISFCTMFKPFVNLIQFSGRNFFIASLIASKKKSNFPLTSLTDLFVQTTFPVSKVRKPDNQFFIQKFASCMKN